MPEVVIVELRADASKLIKGFDQAQQKSKGFGANIKKGAKGAQIALNKTSGALKKAGASASKSRSLFSKLGGSLKSAFLPMIAATAIIGGISRAFANAIGIITDFQEATAELSAITGATGKDLEFLTKKAQKLGPAFGTSAKDIITGFKLVGSAVPSLLKNGEALADTTEAALLLAQASGLELEPAVNALTTTMNQFNIPASKAIEIVNALAAGSKEGASEVPQIADALEKVGAVADATNTSVFETIAAIETVASKSLEGAEAGTQLRNVFLTLASAEVLPKEARQVLEGAGIDLALLADESVSLSDKLKALQPIMGDAAKLTKVFGKESITAANALIDSAQASEDGSSSFDDLTAAITGTNTAFEQAAVISETLAFQQKKTEAAYESLILSIDDGNGIVTETITGYTEFKGELFGLLTVMNDAEASNEELGRSFLDTVLALNSFTGIGGSALKDVDDRVQEIQASLDGVVDSAKAAAIAIQDQRAALGQLADGVDSVEAALEAEVAKTKELIKESIRAEGAQKQRLQNAVDISVKVVNALDAEIKARDELAEEQVALELEAEQQVTQLTDKEIAARKRAREKAAAARLKLEGDLKELRITVLKDGIDEELALLDLAFEKEIEKFQGNAEGIKLLEMQLGMDKEEIRKEFAQKEGEARQNSLKDIEANRRLVFDIEIDAAQRAADEKKLLATTEEADAQDLANAEVDIEIEKLTTIIALRKAAGEDSLALEQQLANIRRDIRQEEIAAERELEAQREEARAEVLQGAQDLFFTLLDEQTQRKLELSEAETDRELALIDAQLKSETISQGKREALEKQRQQIEEQGVEQAKEIERDAAQRDLAVANFEAIINGAVAITKALTVDPTGILAIAVAAQTAIQLALINAASVPAFAQGTSLVTGGTPGKDSVLAHLMPGERVVTTANNKKHWDPLEAMRNGNYEQFVWNKDIAPALREADKEYKRREARQHAQDIAQHTWDLSGTGGGKFNDKNLIASDRDTRKVLYGIHDQLEQLNQPGSPFKRNI